jgi:hypothetical protein
MSAQPDEAHARRDEPEPIDTPPAAIRWQSWPAAERLGRTGLVVVALLAATVLVRLTAGRTVLALLALAALLAALWRYFLPVQFELDEHGVERSLFGWRRHVRWSAVARYTVCPAGVLLVPNRRQTPMSAFAGLFLPFAENREAVLLRLRYYLGPPA